MVALMTTIRDKRMAIPDLAAAREVLENGQP